MLKEAYEQVEDGWLSGEDFLDFVFTNPVRFRGEANRGFFRNTVVENAMAELLVSSQDED